MRRHLLRAIDILLIAIAMPAAIFLRENFVFDVVKFDSHLPLLAATLIVAVPMLSLFGVDRAVWRYSTLTELTRIASAVGAILLAATLITFFYNRLDGISRSVPVLQFLLAVVGMMTARVVAHASRISQPSPRPFTPIQHRQQQSVLLVGLSSLSELYAKAVREYGQGNVRVVGVVDYAPETDGLRIEDIAVYSRGKTILEVVQQLAVHGIFVDRVVITTTLDRLGDTGRHDLAAFATKSSIPVEMFADNIGLVNWAGAEIDPTESTVTAPAGKVTFVFSETELNEIARRPYWRMKRLVDFVVSLGMIVCLWPIAALVALLVAVEIGRPVLFWQIRPGVGGAPFKLLKFRTMSAQRDRTGRVLTDAERLGSIGRFLRKTRLDELPQLVNILRGEMSFIGPRPLLPVDQAPAYSARLLVRPGLTGWGQIKGGRDIPAADKAALDIWYVRNASFALDYEIIKGTIPMVLHGEHVHRDAIEQAWQDLRQSGICRPV